MSDILSQEEIDKLLNAAASGGLSGPTPASFEPELDPGEVAELAVLVNLIHRAANDTIGTLIARPAKVSDGRGEFIPVDQADSGDDVVLKAPFRSGFSGEISIVIEKSTAAVLADLILGGDGAGKTDLAEGDDDAVKELAGQILGNAAPQITAKTGVQTGFDAVSFSAPGPAGLKSAVGEGRCFVSTAQLTVDGVMDAKFKIILDATTASEIVQGMEQQAEEQAAVSAPVRMREPETEQRRPAPAAPAAPQYAAHDAPDIRNIDLILDIEVEIMVRLGNSQMPLREIQKLRPGSIIDLDRDTDALVELVVNERVIAKGELVVVSSDHFALRVTEIVTPTERIRSLGG